MKSVFKTVAPIAITITFALSGVAMADTATTAAKSTDSAKISATESTKPAVQHHKHKASVEVAKSEAAKNTVVPANTEKSVASKPTTEKTAPTVNSSKKVEPTKA